jgi:hypothetical protein
MRCVEICSSRLAGARPSRGRASRCGATAWLAGLTVRRGGFKTHAGSEGIDVPLQRGRNGSGMAAFIWNTNPRMWSVAPPFADSFDVLKAYICDPSAYVYWSTPRHQDEIALGDAAFILRTPHERGPSGIVACGIVEEAPQQLVAGGSVRFLYAPRLAPPGWDEAVAPSSWKTGIRIQHTFWDAPLDAGRAPAIGSVERLSDADVAAIAKMMKGR